MKYIKTTFLALACVVAFSSLSYTQVTDVGKDPQKTEVKKATAISQEEFSALRVVEKSVVVKATEHQVGTFEYEIIVLPDLQSPKPEEYRSGTMEASMFRWLLHQHELEKKSEELKRSIPIWIESPITKGRIQCFSTPPQRIEPVPLFTRDKAAPRIVPRT